MKLRKALPLAASLIASMGMAGCGATTSPQHTVAPASTTLNLLETQDVSTLDPNKADDEVSFTVLTQVMDGLTRVGENGNIVPDMASSWDVKNGGKQYIFHLRNAKWSDGKPVTAKDFEYAWKRELNPANAETYAYIFTMIKGADNYNAKKTTADEVGVKALDDKTLEVDLNYPTPYFLSLMAYVPFFPAREDFVKAQGNKYGTSPDTLLYNGAFKLSSWTQGSTITAVKNPDYYDANKVKLNKVVWTIVKDQGTRVNLYDTHKADITTLTAQYVPHYKGKPDFHEMTLDAVYYLEYNPSFKAFKNPDIRKALSESQDRNLYVQTILNNGSTMAQGLVTPSVAGDPNKPSDFRSQAGKVIKDNDPNAAKVDFAKGLQETGLTVADINKAHLLTYDDDVSKKAAQLLTEQWKQVLGIDIQIDSLPFKVKLDHQKKKQYDMVFSGWGADYNDPMTFLDYWTTGNPENDVSYANPAYDKLINAARNEVDPSKRMQDLIDAEKLFLSTVPVSPFYYKGQAYLQNVKLKGMIWYPVGADYDLKSAYFQQ